MRTLLVLCLLTPVSCLLFPAFCLSLAAAEPLAVGKSSVEVRFDDVQLKLFAYKPEGFRDGPMLMVFHGVLRNADEYRDHAVPMGDRFGALVVSPLFDEKQFPKAKYQFGGIVANGRAVPREERTGEFVNRIAKEIRRREGRPDMRYALIGHSGGGQFLGRLAAFVATDAERIVVANPSSYTFPNVEATFPYGFGGLPAELQSEDVLKAYLAQPVTIYVGSKDVIRDEYFDDSEQADVQGLSRFERGRHVYSEAKQLADEKKWPFRWTLVTAQGVEHDHEKMFNAPECAKALGWKPVR
jgi:pimeloyl-ACP methyl ester carboxylesterase